MPTFPIIKMTDLSPLHIGSGRENYDSAASSLQSDTLSAALAAIRAQQGKTEDMEEFLSSFTLSSAFPYWQDCYFLPKAQGRLAVSVNGKEEHEYRKKLKKIKLIESSLWNKLANGESLVVEESQVQGDYLLPKGKNTGLLSMSEVAERVTMPRDGLSDATPFFFEWHYFAKDAGLYCLIDAQDSLFEELKSLFAALGESGIGTDKNVGGGKFNVEAGSLSLRTPDQKDGTMLLSLYIPTKEELDTIDLEKSRYALCLRGGFMAGSTNENMRHLRKRSIYAFNVGSVFMPPLIPTGKVVNLKPEWKDPTMHPVYRSGRPFVVPIKQPDV